MFIANIDNICLLDEILNTLLSFDIFLVVSIESLENRTNFCGLAGACLDWNPAYQFRGIQLQAPHLSLVAL